MVSIIDSFTVSTGYFWLSNFYESDIYGFGSTEAYYQAMKTKDHNVREEFRTMTPHESKKAGRKITLRDDWEVVKDAVMFKALHKKFQDPDLKQKLADTGTAMLIEGNTWHDNYWGNCLCWKDGWRPEMKRKYTSTECVMRGKNMLGTQLMILRGLRQSPLEI